ncbi:hypothetical protein [Vibrio sp. 10N.261.55.A7]|uniref:hypothetical protein n=1 Tax=Vibrio sp. 10N.261.55.A7 TaxID=1880851 RepID=UPI000C81FA93|nr:hypothetical protein [Vibrio sp. 10N.261.55.A7]PMJ92836.1 hypothetical protein BCU12_06745 [Vibrio sp. 10N.261.55.A7]
MPEVTFNMSPDTIGRVRHLIEICQIELTTIKKRQFKINDVDVDLFPLDEIISRATSLILGAKRVQLSHTSEREQYEFNISEVEQLIDQNAAFIELENDLLEMFGQSLKSFRELISLFYDFYDRNVNSKKNRTSGLLKQLEVRQKEVTDKSKTILDNLESNAEKLRVEAKRSQRKLLDDLSNEVANKLSESNTEFKKMSSELTRSLNRHSNQLQQEITDKSLSRLDQEVGSAVISATTHIEKKETEVLKNIRSEVEGLSNKVSEHINEFVVLNDALRNTLNFVSSDALADSSLAHAKEEKKTADDLRSYGVVWLFISILLFLGTFDYDKLVDAEGIPQYTLILLRSFFLIVGITPAFYLLRESARHRTDERRYRQKGIQLATIDGYFAEFDKNERNISKKELSKHYFHGADHFVDSTSVDNVQNSYSKVFDTVLKQANSKSQSVK